jgi:hypothetical protein
LVNYPEQDIVTIHLMMQKQMVKFIGYGKDHMHVVDWQQISFPFHQPLLTVNAATFGTVPVTTTVIEYLFMATLIAIFHPATHYLGSALMQCMQCPQMMVGQRFLMVQFWQEIFYDSRDFSL